MEFGRLIGIIKEGFRDAMENGVAPERSYAGPAAHTASLSHEAEQEESFDNLLAPVIELMLSPYYLPSRDIL